MSPEVALSANQWEFPNLVCCWGYSCRAQWTPAGVVVRRPSRPDINP